ncbi:outer membrane receptor protein involved in Fe transport [Duganella sp. 1411]|uniref:TonB-dependent receptor plug domain-containing protein n=1 Tax=Duganella sp. 1411 TaxID=2806572 RepID=UPI001AE89A32|nr:TonB-dependent receptor [Duganella sp. 1411]MBP1205031.1 outer membrane receptor protein involved in Fe transport [Duganella sp. 1411]
MNRVPKYVSPPLLALLALCGRLQAAEQGPAAPAPAAPVQAAPASDAAAADQPMATVEVNATLTDGRRESVAMARSIGAAELTRFGDASVLDVLRRQPGIVVNGVPGRKGGEIGMRGLGAGYVRLLVNGETAPPNFSLDNLSPDMVDRIDILPVPSAELGMQAIAGTINILLKKTGSKRQRQMNAGLNQDQGRVKPFASATLGDTQGKLAWLVTGSVRRQNGDEHNLTDTEGVEADGGALSRILRQYNHDRGWSASLAPRATWKFDADESLGVQGFISKTRYDSNGFDATTFVRGPATGFANDTYASQGENSTARANLNWLRKLGQASRLELKLGGTTSRKRSGSQIDFYDEGRVQNLRADADSDGRLASVKLNTTLSARHALVSGAEFQRDGSDETRVNLIDAVDQLGGTGSAFHVRIKRYAAYAQDEWEVSGNWSMTLGLRWEQVDLLSASNAGVNVETTQKVLSPVVQNRWRVPGSKDQFRLGLARTWRMPDTASLIAGRTLSNVNTVTTPDTTGNPNLKPETALGLDAAYEHYLAGDGMFSANVFARRIADYSVVQESLVDGRWVAAPRNVGRAFSRGIELEGKLKLSQLVAGMPAVDLRANLTRVWSTVDAVPGPDNRIGRQAPLSANVGLDYALRGLPLTAGASLGYVKNGTVRLSPYQRAYDANVRTLDVYALWKIDAATRLRLGASNVLHQDAVKATSFSSDQLTQRRTTVSPTNVVAKITLEIKY